MKKLDIKGFLKNNKHFITIGVLLTIAMFTWGLRDVIKGMELRFYDYMAKKSIDKEKTPYPKADKNIIIVSMDDYSAQLAKNYPKLEIGRMPWPRKIIAEMIEFINKGNPKLIYLDLLFSGVEGYEKGNISSDKKFEETLKSTKNIILAEILYKKKAEKLTKNDFLSSHLVDFDDTELLKNEKLLNSITYKSKEKLKEEFFKNSKQIGIVNTLYNPKDNLVRYHAPIFSMKTDNGRIYLPSAPMAMLLNQSKDQKVAYKDGNYILGNRIIATSDKGGFLINWHGGSRTYKNIPAIKLLLTSFKNKGKVNNIDKKNIISSDIFKDKIVIVGLTRSGTDIHGTPVDTRHTGPEIVATATDNLFNDTDTTNPKARPFITKSSTVVNIFLIIALCLISGIYAYKTKYNFLSLAWLILMIFGYMLFVFYMFVIHRYWLYITMPTIFMTFTTLGVYIYKITLANKAKQEIEELFGKFVSPEVVKKLVDNPQGVERDCKRKELTVLFSDIRGFTTLSEKSNPQDLVNQLNEFFDEMTEIIFEHDGTLDKFIGDAIMAFFGDPLPMEDHPKKAVLAAAQMVKKLDELNERWEQEGKQKLNIGIGINTGDMVVGHVGARKHLSYTVMGDNVNLASRLEGLTKDYKTSIIIGKSTNDAIQNEIPTKFLTTTKVKGKEEEVKIYTLNL